MADVNAGNAGGLWTLSWVTLGAGPIGAGDGPLVMVAALIRQLSGTPDSHWPDSDGVRGDARNAGGADASTRVS